MAFLRSRKQEIQSVLLCALLLSTQISVFIPNPFSVNGVAGVNLSVLTMLLIFLYTVPWRILLRRDFSLLAENDKRVFWTTFAFTVVYFAVTVLRYLFQQRLVVSTSMFLTVFCGATLFLLLRVRKVSAPVIVGGVLLVLTCINAYTLVQLFVHKGVVRSSNLIHLLGNINIYIGLVMLSVPVLLYYYVRVSRHAACRWILAANLLITGTVLLLSGSRFGLLSLFAELFLMYFVLFGIRIHKKALICGTVLIIVLTIIAAPIYSHSPEAREDIHRTFYYPSRVVRMLFNTGSGGGNTDVPLLPPEATEPSDPTEPPSGEWMPWDPDHMNAPEDGKVHSLIRKDLFSRAFTVLQKYWLFGTGRDSLYMYGWGHQSTHNLFLDAVLCYGVFVGIVYLALVLYPFVHVIMKYRRNKLGMAYLIGFLFLLLYSMVEPLLSNKAIVVLTVWSLYAAVVWSQPLCSSKNKKG